VIFLIGDFTGVIGDTSDKNAERPMLVEDTVKKNMETYLEQVGKILDISKVEVVRNSEWLSPLSYLEICKQADAFSINDFVSRELIAKRLASGSRVSMRELMYPLMQGYDSVALKADVELGGTDQRFNLLAGRTLQKLYGQPEQQIVMGPLINGLDGRKMSSSWGNTINLMDDPNTMYGKVMSMQDDLIVEYFTLLTRVLIERIDEIKAGLADKSIHPMEAKKELAQVLVTMYHSNDEANKAAEYFKKTIQDREVPTEVPEFELGAEADVVSALVTSGLVKSKSEARRVLEEKGIKVNGTVVEDGTTTLKAGDILQKGKFNFAKVK
ncbi:MAG: tyrosyl-tRNA synthetase, tyrosyl-tRNA synthetase, partial [Candidatus Parcubacteria bacterium]|jgi:tyrosyl-tRNA synthetase